MSFGIIEIIMLLLGMAGFGLQATPKAPTVEQALQYAVADADEIEGARGMAKMTTGIDVTTDIADTPGCFASSPGPIRAS